MMHDSHNLLFLFYFVFKSLFYIFNDPKYIIITWNLWSPMVDLGQEIHDILHILSKHFCLLDFSLKFWKLDCIKRYYQLWNIVS